MLKSGMAGSSGGAVSCGGSLCGGSSAGGCVGAGFGFCVSGSSGGGVDETGFVFSSACAGCFGSAAYSVPDGSAGVLFLLPDFRVRFLPDSLILPEQTDWQEYPRLIQPMLHLPKCRPRMDCRLSSDSGSCFRTLQGLSVRPARRSAYRFIFIIRITSTIQDTDKNLKVQRESAVFEKITFSAQKPGLHLPPVLQNPATHLPPCAAAVHMLPKPRR